jgi:hypothetical protein
VHVPLALAEHGPLPPDPAAPHGPAENPALSIASLAFLNVMPGPLTVAEPDARLTVASTPLPNFVRTLLTVLTQLPHVIPDTLRVMEVGAMIVVSTVDDMSSLESERVKFGEAVLLLH